MKFDNTDEKRQFHRILYNAKAKLAVEDQFIPCKIMDLSLNGCMLKIDQFHLLMPDKHYQLYLELSDDKEITMKLSLRHQQENMAGLQCEHIDIDSISQLRRIVELNLGDGDILERDLNKLFRE